MPPRRVVDELLARRLGAHLGYVPARWPRRVYEVLERLAQSGKIDQETLLARLADRIDGAAMSALIDAATVGHTSFFRHPEHFEALRKVLPKLAASRKGPVRIWCAACSTGEEAYSVALCAEELGVLVDILATDVSLRAVETARRGRYPRSSLGPSRPGSANEAWTAPAALRQKIRFEVASLAGTLPSLGEGSFDLIFCRNVLIYFDRESVPEVLAKLAGHLHPRGVIVVSPADAVLPLPDCLVHGSSVGWLKLAKGADRKSLRSISIVPVARPQSMRPFSPASVKRVSLRSLRVPGISAGRRSMAPPPDSSTSIERAARLLGSGQAADAETVLTDLLNAVPDDMAAWFLLGEALVQRGEASQARAAFVRAARCSPRDATIDGESIQWAAKLRAKLLEPE